MGWPFSCYIIRMSGKVEIGKKGRTLEMLIFFYFILMQWVAGFVSFLYPQIAGPMKITYMPIHVFFGLLAFVLAIIAALLGITEKAIFHM